MAKTKNITDLSILVATRELIAERNHWTQGASARDKAGKEVLADSENAVCFCTYGAMSKVYFKLQRGSSPSTRLRLSLDKAEHALRVQMGQYIADFNDNHTHEEVLAAFDEAIGAVRGSPRVLWLG